MGGWTDGRTGSPKAVIRSDEFCRKSSLTHISEYSARAIILKQLGEKLCLRTFRSHPERSQSHW